MNSNLFKGILCYNN